MTQSLPDGNNVPITVLMPAFNAGKYIREAVDSVLSQTFGEFELLIINDGSTDDTLEILNSYKDSRIIIYSQENRGVIGALNKGLELAKGKYIVRFDADDICYPTRLAEQYDFMEANPQCVLLGSAADYIDKDGNFLFEWQPPGYEPSELKKAVMNTCPLDHPTAIYRKENAEKIGGYPSGAIHFEDHLFWVQFFQYGEVRNLHKTLIKHRFNPESVTIDEKWRGSEFNQIKHKAIKDGYIDKADEIRLKQILKQQDLKKYKEAAYYSMIAKKYLWNKHEPRKARQNIMKAISLFPGKLEPYLLLLISFMPEKLITGIYKKMK